MILDFRSECCWRLGKWMDEEVMESSDFHGSFFKSMKHLRQKDAFGVNETRKDFILKTVENISKNGIENLSQIYSTLTQLSIYKEMDILSDLLFSECDREKVNKRMKSNQN